MCKKVEHKTYWKARSHLASLAKRTGSSSLQVYKCKECGWYHVGHRKVRLRGRKKW